MKSKVMELHGEYWCNLFTCTLLHGSRENEFSKFCSGKKVLHVGCTDYPFDGINGLHKSLVKFCTVDGVDIDKDGIDRFKKVFSGNFFYNIKDVNSSYDIVLIPEVLEHIDNPGNFLSEVDKIDFETLIITVPDVLCCYNYTHFEFKNNTYAEACHPDHVAWYSPHTLKNIIERNTRCKCKEFYLINGRSIMTVAKKEKL